MGFAAKGNAAAIILLRMVLAATALAAYRAYVSMRKLMHCWKMMLKPAPMKPVARTGRIPRSNY